MIALCVLGPSGRTGGKVVELAAARSTLDIVAVVDRPDSELIGHELLPGVTVTAELEAGLRGADVYIDFTTPTATASAVRIATECGTAAVIGTTGLDLEAIAAIEEASQRVAVVTAPNFSLGVNLLFGLAETAARVLGAEFDLEVVELHHRQKRDAPSGTAIALAQALATGRGVDYDASKRYAREGNVGARPEGEIGVVAVRGGDVVGEHTAFLIGDNERIEITHRAANRGIFAAGALRAAEWIAGQPPGHYSMKDVLGL